MMWQVEAQRIMKLTSQGLFYALRAILDRTRRQLVTEPHFMDMTEHVILLFGSMEIMV